MRERPLASTLRSGTIKTLGALVAALSVGAAMLLWMETVPARVEVPLPLQAVDADDVRPELGIIHQTEIPLQYIKWRNIVVHDAGRDGPGIVRRCHFLIGNGESFGDGAIASTRLWRLQKEGGHIHVPGTAFDSESIGVAVLCDTRRTAPTRRQLAALIHLVRGLQVTFQIPPARVSLHSDWGEPGCPGDRFPARAFRSALLPATR